MRWEGGSAKGRWPAGTKYQLEMGGKNPVIVLEDADLDRAVEATVSGGLRTCRAKVHGDQPGVCAERRVRSVQGERLLSRVKEIPVGDGMDPRTWMGPLVSEEQLQRVLSYIRKGVEEGALLLCGGRRLEGRSI